MATRSSKKPLGLVLVGVLAVIALLVAGLYWQAHRETTKSIDTLPSMSVEQLKQYNGQNGQPTYFAYEGRIYDVSASRTFENGKHFDHMAGTDLTGKLEGAPHGIEVFAPFKVVAKLIP